jgi:O-antigen ligase
LFSFSQSSFTALIVGVCIAAWLAWRRRALALIAGVAVVLLAAAIALPSVRHRSLNSASGGRSKLVSQGIQIAIHHPVAGVGIGAFKYAYARREHLRQRAPAVGASHNTPVTVAAETGVPGLLLFAWLLVSAFVLAFRRGAGRIAVAFGVILAAIAVHSLFYNAFFEDPVTWGAFGLVPLAIAAAEVRAFVSAPRRPAVAQQPAPDGARPGDRTRAEAG